MLNEDHPDDQRDRQKHVDHGAPHVDEEIPDQMLATQRTDDGRQRAASHRCRQEHVRQNEEYLAEIVSTRVDGS